MLLMACFHYRLQVFYWCVRQRINPAYDGVGFRFLTIACSSMLSNVISRERRWVWNQRHRFLESLREASSRLFLQDIPLTEV